MREDWGGLSKLFLNPFSYCVFAKAAFRQFLSLGLAWPVSASRWETDLLGCTSYKLCVRQELFSSM